MSSDSSQTNTRNQQEAPGAQPDIDSGAQPDIDPEPGVRSAFVPPVDTLWSGKTRKLLRKLMLLSVGILVLGQAAIVWISLDTFERELEPQLIQKAIVVGSSITGEIRYAIAELGIPLRELVGVEPFFNNLLKSNTDIEYLILQHSANSDVLAQGGLSDGSLDRITSGLPSVVNQPGMNTEIAGFSNITFQISDKETTVALLHVGISNEYIRSQLSEIFYDVITIAIVSLMVALQFLVFFTGERISEPIARIKLALREGADGLLANRFISTTKDEIGALSTSFNRTLNDLTQRYEDLRFETNEVKSAQIDDNIAREIQLRCDYVSDRYRFGDGMRIRPRNAFQIRLPLFLFLFSEGLSRSFLPLFINQYTFEDSPLLISFPIALYMSAIMAVVFLGGRVIDRFGSRYVFLIGVIPAVIGYVGTFTTQGYYDLVFWRLLSGIGYGFIFIAAQAWVTEHSAKGSDRAQDMTLFFSATFISAVCGPAIGGIIAVQIGFETTFLLSAMMALVSAFIVYKTLDSQKQSDAEDVPPSQQTMPDSEGWLILLRNPRFIAVTVFAAIPTKMMLSGLLFYLVPLYLNELGKDPATIGRVIMLYGIVPVFLLTYLARVMDRYKNQIVMTTISGVLSGIGCFFVLSASLFGGPANALAVTILILGLSHALSTISQPSVVQKITQEHNATIGQTSIINAYLLLETSGLILGPIIAGILVVAGGYLTAIILLGFISLVCILLYQTIMILIAKELRDHEYILSIKQTQQAEVLDDAATDTPIAKEPSN